MQGLQENFNKEDMPYNIRVLLDNERETSPVSSSGSEETDQMPDFAHKLAVNKAKEWDFGQGELGRRKSEILSQNLSPNGNTQVFQNTVNGFEQGLPNTKAWTPLGSGKVNVKPSFFSPLNLGDFNQNDKKAYFVTIEGYNQVNSKRFFKIERLCYSLQGSSTNGGKDATKFLYLSLWNDCHNNQEEMENIFEPWIYAVPHLHFRLVVKVYMTHANEDPFIFDFPIDLRQFALPTQDKRTQSLEIAYAEQAPNQQSANNITLHVQVTNEKLLAPPGFRNNQDPNNQASFDYTIILRQFFVGLPLTRTGNFSSQSPLLPHMHRLHDVYGKRGSAISLGQDQRLKLIEAPQSPLSWSNFSGESSPNTTNKFTFPGTNSQLDPMIPPGIMTSNNSQELGSFRQSGSSIFKFNHRQQRYSIQPVKREPEEEPKKFMRMQTSDLSNLAGERGSLNVVNAAVKAFMNGSRKESIASDSTSGTNFGTINKLQQNNNETDAQNKSQGTPNASYLDAPETNQTEEVIQVTNNTTITTETTVGAEEFKIEAYVGRMVEYAKTYQGSKVLQKFVATAQKDELDIVVREIGEKIGELMLDPYANYMIQTLVQNGHPRQRLYLLQKIAPSFTAIARDKKGTHSLQAIVALIDSQDEHALMRNIVGPFVFELSMDPRANYVIQKLINIIPPDSSSFLYQPLFDNFVQIANNSFGLLVLKQMMARVEQKDALKHRVVELTCLNFEKLIQNPYGNYAIQHIVENYPKDSLMIMNKILTKIIPYSSQKISSNVIEKCLIVCDSLFRRRVVEEILRNGRLGDLMKNKYGNFVTLQLLASAVPSDKQKLMQEIYRCANAFNGTKYKTRWLKFVQENPMKINMNSKDELERQLEDEAFESAKIDEDKLEAVKNIWREMTKEEKSDSNNTSFNQSFSSKMPLGKKNYHKRDDSYGYGDK